MSFGRLSFGRFGAYQSGSSGPENPSVADYTVTNDSEWSAVMALSDATLSGKIVEIVGSNFGPLTIANKNIAASGGRLKIRSRDSAATLQRLTFSGTNSAIDIAIRFQMRGWPYNYASMVNFATGTHDDIAFDGAYFRHGHGTNQDDFNILTQYSEYNRVDNVRTASTTPTTYALSWQDPAMSTGWLEFFNRGTQDVYVSVGGSGVSVSTSGAVQSGSSSVKVNRLIPAGTKNRISGLNPTVDTHIAIMTASGTSEVNARSEIGMFNYLASCFQNSGGTIGKLTIRNCVFRDVANAVKGLTGSAGPASEFYVDSNDFDRIYMDAIYSSGKVQVTRNLISAPFARSGIAENLNGDAYDPHGDGLQMAGAVGTNATISDALVAGNRMRIQQRRAGCSGQGEFISDNDANPSYQNYRSISNIWLGGAPNGQNCGEPGFPVGDSLWYGSTVLDMSNLAGGNSGIRMNTDGNYTVCVNRSICQGILFDDQPFITEQVLNIVQEPDPAALFPNFNLTTGANTRSEIETMLTGVGVAANVGAVASANAIDWATTNLNSIVKWENVPSGIGWSDLTNQAANTQITLPLRKILNLRTSQSVVPGSGVEWRTVAADKTTEVVAWTSGTGTVEPGQYLQIRTTSSPDSLGNVTATVTVNGFAESVVIQSGMAVPTTYLTSAGGYFVDPITPGAGVTHVSMRGFFKFPNVTNFKLFTQLSLGCDLNIVAGALRLRLEDGAGNTLLGNTYFASGATLVGTANWHNIRLDVDQVAGVATLIVDGVSYTQTFTPGASAFFQPTQTFAFLATSTGATPAPVGTTAADMSIYFNDVLRKSIANVAAIANADTWKQGADFT